MRDAGMIPEILWAWRPVALAVGAVLAGAGAWWLGRALFCDGSWW